MIRSVVALNQTNLDPPIPSNKPFNGSSGHKCLVASSGGAASISSSQKSMLSVSGM